MLKPAAVIATVAVMIAASCAAGETTTPGLANGENTDTETVPPVTPADATAPPTPTTPVSPPTTAPEAGGSATDSTTDASEPAPTDTTPAPESTDATVDLATQTCASLDADGYETRKATVAALSDDVRARVETVCADSLGRLDAAAAIEARMTAFNSAANGLAATNLVCDGGDFQLDVTNNVDHPIGVHAALQLQADGIEAPIGSTLEPLVIWQLDPGATATLQSEYRLTRDVTTALTCQVDLTAFDATPGDADASLGGEPRQPELAGDDPALWLPALVAQGDALPGSGITDAAAAVEDVRSTSYAQVLASTTAEIDQLPPSVTISVCSASVERPDDRTISLVYFAEPTDRSLDLPSVLQHGIFRRGNDSQWRWLSDAKYFDSRDFWNCGTPSANL